MNRRDALCLVGTTVTGLAVPSLFASNPAGGSAPDGRQFDTVLNTFRVTKKDPHAQAETDHHCVRLNDDVLQCVIFQAGGRKLIGVEYVITDRLYRQLPLEEKAYWHPHAYEVLAGQLIAPDLRPEGEKALLGGLVTTWGKTWQTWPDPATPCPEGEPRLLWSVTRDGQLDPELLEARDRRFNVSTRANRRRRQRFGLPVPQVNPPESAQEIGRQWEVAGTGRPRRV